jgi:hypothetical protein
LNRGGRSTLPRLTAKNIHEKMVDFKKSFCYKGNLFCGNNSVVECNLAKVEVAGPNPVSRSIKIKGLGHCLAPFLLPFCLLHPFLHPFVIRKPEIACDILKPIATTNE